MSRVNLGTVSRTLEALVAHSDLAVAMLDRTTGQACPVSPSLAAAPEGLLPVFLVAADTVWRDATGKSFGVDLQRDPRTLLGFRARGVGGGPFSSVMLAMMEAMAQVARPGMILVNDFDTLWRSVERDLTGDGPRRSAIRTQEGATPTPGSPRPTSCSARPAPGSP